MGSTNYIDTFIQVAEDCPVTTAEQPPLGNGSPTIAGLQFALIAEHPYEFTSDDVLFDVHATRRSLDAEERPAAREAFFARSQACLRASPLPKKYGWGIHHDAEGRVALVPVGSAQYQTLAADPHVQQRRAMRSRRG